MGTPKKHHLIPNFLIRNFAIDSESSTKQVWHYIKGKEQPHKANSKNVFAQNNFYTGPDGDIDIEQQLSKKESSYAKTVAHVLENRELEPSNITTLTDFIHNLNCRGHIRDQMHDCVKRLHTPLSKVLAGEHPAYVHNHLSLMSDEEARSLAQALVYTHAKHIRDPLIHVNLVQTWEAQLKKIIELLGPDMLERGMHKITPLLEQWISSVDLKKTHLENLPEAMRQALPTIFESFEWDLLQSDEEPFLLGDTGAINYSEVDNCWKHSAYVSNKDLRYVFLPLSPEVGLLGKHPNAQEQPEVWSTKNINAGIASASLSSFISSQDSPGFQTLQSKIGMDHDQFSTEMFEEGGVLEEEKWYMNTENPSDISVSLEFRNNCSLDKNSKEKFLRLANLFKMSKDCLSLAEPFHATCIFTDDVVAVVKEITNKDTNATGGGNPDANICWIDVIPSPRNKFRNTLVVNTAMFKNQDGAERIGLMFKFLRKLFSLAMITHYNKTEIYQDGNYLDAFKTTATVMIRWKKPTQICHALFNTHVKLDAEQNKVEQDDLIHRVILEHVESQALNYIESFQTDFLPTIERYKNTGTDEDLQQLANVSQTLINLLGISLADYFAISSVEERDNFFERLKSHDIFRFFIEDEWNTLADLCDSDSEESKYYALMQSLERILAHCGLYWYPKSNGKGQSDLIVGMSTYDLYASMKKESSRP